MDYKLVVLSMCIPVLISTTDVPSPPGKPRILNIKSREVRVAWDKSDAGNSSISVYVVHVSKCANTSGSQENREVVVGGSTQDITIRDLSPHTCYQVRVMSRNGVGRSEDSEPSDVFFTLEEPPSGPPINVKAESPKSTEMHVDWDHIPKSKLNGELKGYELTYMVQDGEPDRVRLEDPYKHNIVLYGLQPFTMYHIQLLAFNDAGSGPSANVSVTTAEGVPSKPRITHITKRRSKSFYVHWEPPKTLNGRLEKYELQWSYNSSSATRNLNNNAAFIGQLEPFTEYMIRVAAYTGGGKGEFSDDFPGITDVEGPSAPTITNVTVIGRNSIYLQWDPPEIYYKTINNYFIKWWDVQEPSYYRDKLIDGSQLEVTLSDFPEYRDYRLKMSGVTNGIFSKTHFVGEFTEQVEFTLGGIRITRPPQNETVMQSSRVALYCTARGSPKPKVIWYHNNQEMVPKKANYRISRRKGILRFIRVLVIDRGTYKCKAYNELEEKFSEEVHLEVHYPVEIPKALCPQCPEGGKVRTVEYGKLVSLQCTAVGIPMPSLQWRKNGISITKNSTDIVYKTLNEHPASIKSILKFNATEDAEYECEAVNVPIGLAKVATRRLKIKVPPESSGSTFVHWGKRTCPDTTSLVYSGYAAGNHYADKAGPANTMCLPREPIYGEYDTARLEGGASISGAEYHDWRTTKPDSTHIKFHDVPCAVCQLTREAHVLMIPGRNQCYPGWKIKYHGYLIAGHRPYASSEYLCMNKYPDTVVGDSRQDDGLRLYLVESRCGSLPCPPYKPNATMTCVVCAK